MLIGAFSFVRILWIRFEIWRSPDDIDPSLLPTADTGLSNRPQRARTVRKPGDVFKLFSPALRRTVAEKEDPSDDFRLMYTAVEGSRWKRYLVGWLPWLSLVPWFRRSDVATDSGKRQGRESSETHAD
jgi:hypothetical protein